MKCNRIGFHLFSKQKGHIKMPTVDVTKENAFRYHQGGRLQEAKQLYLQITPKQTIDRDLF